MINYKHLKLTQKELGEFGGKLKLNGDIDLCYNLGHRNICPLVLLFILKE